ncbi:MAG: hypothetical protein K2N56_00915 [Oscillospiraceae bacterium]|nr:hypothetical protein [Oscillospiraceae bacterium]
MRSEEFFNILDDMDDHIISEIYEDVQRPQRLAAVPRSPKRLPKLLLGGAACIAVLAAGIFTLTRFRLNGGGIDPAPVQTGSGMSVSDSASSGAPDDSSGNGSAEEEHLAIIRELIRNASDVDNIFNRLNVNREDGYLLKMADGRYNYNDYCLIGENRKTEPSGLFDVPQTCEGVEELLHRYFTRRAVKSYMEAVGTGHTAVDDDGNNIMCADRSLDAAPTLIEAGGQLYRTQWGMIEDVAYIDPATIKITSHTDNVIKFIYSERSNSLIDQEGIALFEDGSWKLDFFYNMTFIPEMPTEFSEEDLELQDILNSLPGEAIAPYFWFDIGKEANMVLYRFRASDDQPEKSYALMPTNGLSYWGIEYPHTLEQLEELLLKYYTQEATEEYMARTGKGTMTENADGTYTVMTDGGEQGTLPACLEIDGNLYFDSSGCSGLPYWETAKVTEKTSDCIRFSVFCLDVRPYVNTGMVKFERGGWKLYLDPNGVEAKEFLADPNK